MDSISLFPTPIWYKDIPIDTLPLIEFSYGCRFADPLGREVSNNGGWHSDYFSGNVIKELRELEKAILESAIICTREYGYGDVNLAITNLWININEHGHSNSVHIHPSSLLSGVFYVMGTPGQGSIVFHRNQSDNFIIHSAGKIEVTNPFNASSGSFEPITGRLILFPSFVPHEVYANNLEEDRISISFNIIMDS